jgi:hypothetical protein
MKLGRGVITLIKAEAVKASFKKPMVLVMDCGCMMNQESVEVDIREDRDEAGFEPYFVKNGVRFLVRPKIRHLADEGRLGVMIYGGGRFRRLEFSTRKD